ncbi:MAG: hypothetical protein Q8R16_04860 [bacterium]|nr:hypothetical protein [bacterium]
MSTPDSSALDDRVLRTITEHCDADGKPRSVEEIASASGMHIDSVRTVLERLEHDPPRVMRTADGWLPYTPTRWEREACQRLFGSEEARALWEQLRDVFAARSRR